MRLSGLASGMDTDEIVKKLMSAQRIPLDNMSQKKQLLEWKRDDYRALNNKILEFRNAAFDMKLQSSYLTKKVSSTHEQIVSAVGSAVTNDGQYTIKIKDLAKPPAINSAALTGKTGSSAVGLTADATLAIEGSKGTANIIIDQDETIDGLVKAINQESAATGVKASFDNTMKRIFFTSTTTGDASEIKLNNGASNDLNTVLGIGTYAKGTDAVVEFNGIESRYSSNTFTISGITFTAKEKSDTVVNVNVAQDTQATVDVIKNFVDKYNSLIDEVNKELLEKRERNYQPLTSSQRDEMSDDEIEKWEAKARNGMLAQDQLLTSGLTNLRRSLSDAVGGLPTGQLNSLADIGISNTNIKSSGISGSYLDLGKLYIDETKLKNAITNNPEEVMALFTTDSTTEANDGIATRLYVKASGLFQQIADKAGSKESLESNYLIGKESIAISKQMSNLTVRLQDLETRYYKQFSVMESYINKMNSQSTWLSQQFSS